MIDPSNTYDKDIAKTVAYLCKSDPKLCDIGKIKPFLCNLKRGRRMVMRIRKSFYRFFNI